MYKRQAFIIGESFIDNDSVCLILGDNIFYGSKLVSHLKNAINKTNQDQKATIFGVKVNDPQRYGVISFNKEGNPDKIIEKPKFPQSDYAVAGLYFYPNSVIKFAKTIIPSNRGELEITSLNQIFLDQNILELIKLERDFKWLDTGTHDSLLEASQFIQKIEKKESINVGCLEEIAFQNKCINKEQILKYAEELKTTGYGQTLLQKRCSLLL